jgi:hypothetical protein
MFLSKYKPFKNREKPTKQNSPVSPRGTKYTVLYREMTEMTPDENPWKKST